MSLNHLVQGGAPPPQDIRVKNLEVEGELTASGGVLEAQAYQPTTTYDAPGATVPGGIPGPPLQYIHKIGNMYHMHTLASFTVGTDSTEVVLGMQLPNNIDFGTLAGCIVSGIATHETGGVFKTMIPKNFLIQDNELRVGFFASDGIPFSSNDLYRYTGMISFVDSS
jgi:hypothetical protein